MRLAFSLLVVIYCYKNNNSFWNGQRLSQKKLSVRLKTAKQQSTPANKGAGCSCCATVLPVCGARRRCVLAGGGPGLQSLEEVVALVIDEDESGEVFNVDFPDGFHA